MYTSRFNVILVLFKNLILALLSQEKTLESPLDCKEIQPVHPKGTQSRIFIGRTDAEAEILILCPCDVKKWLIWKDSDAGKDWRREKKGLGLKDKCWDGWMASPTQRTWVWVTLGVGDRQGGLVCCSPWGSQRVGHDWATELNWTELALFSLSFYYHFYFFFFSLLLIFMLLFLWGEVQLGESKILNIHQWEFLCFVVLFI